MQTAARTRRIPRHAAIYGCGHNSCGCNLKLSEVRSESFGVDLRPVCGPLGPKLTPNDPDRTSDNLKLQPHEFWPHP
jgi:hypothetical protein